MRSEHDGINISCGVELMPVPTKQKMQIKNGLQAGGEQDA